jgi:hypothetical protein
MSNVRLEFERLDIQVKKSKWKLYFVVVAEHPVEPDKMVVTTVPSAGQDYFRLKKHADNVVQFEPEATDSGVDGLFVLEREMPVDRTLKVRAFLMHSRKSARQMGDVLQDMQDGFGSDAVGMVTDLMGSASPWLVVAKTAFGLIGGILKKIKDRDFGYLVMDEEFGPEFDGQKELDRTNNFTTHQARLRWSWRIKI